MGTLSLIASLLRLAPATRSTAWRASGRKMLLAVSFIRVRVEGPGEARSRGHLRLRGQSRQLHGHSGAARHAAAAVPLFRQEGPVQDSLSGHAPASAPDTCRWTARSPRASLKSMMEAARIISEPRHLGAELSRRRALGRRAARIQGRARRTSPSRPACRWCRWRSSACANCCPWARFTCERPGRGAGRRPDPHQGHEILRPPGIDPAPPPRGVATAGDALAVAQAIAP